MPVVVPSAQVEAVERIETSNNVSELSSILQIFVPWILPEGGGVVLVTITEVPLKYFNIYFDFHIKYLNITDLSILNTMFLPFL